MVQEIRVEILRELRHIFLLRTQQLYMYPQKPHPQLGNCTHMQTNNWEEHVYFSSGNSVFPHFVLQVFASLSGRSYVVPGGSASKGWVKPAVLLKTILMPSLPFHNYRKKATKIHAHLHHLLWRQQNLLILLSHYVCAKPSAPPHSTEDHLQDPHCDLVRASSHVQTLCSLMQKKRVAATWNNIWQEATTLADNFEGASHYACVHCFSRKIV